ncbi:hypothetical protein ACHAWF_004389, partial [Thalassiosira exigua]
PPARSPSPLSLLSPLPLPQAQSSCLLSPSAAFASSVPMSKPPPDGANLFCSVGSPDGSISDDALREKVDAFLSSLGERRDVLVLPPDFTRFHSKAGLITRYISEHYNFTPRRRSDDDDGGDGDGDGREQDRPPPPAPATSPHSPALRIIPALGTHAPMTPSQIELMFGKDLARKEPDPFVVHDWREDVVTIGRAPASMVAEATRGMVNEPWPAQLNKLVWEKRRRRKRNGGDGEGGEEGGDDEPPPLVLSVGQVVPHEVLGMANFNKNLFIGVGGVDAINLSHFIGAVHGMERLMGRGRNPLRAILNYASEKYLQDELDLWYILTVMGSNDETGEVETKGLYIGNDVRCYDLACELSLQVNFNLLERAPEKVVVYLNDEYRSTWLGNKSIYRTRMAIADGGELIVLAPWVETFGEDGRIDALIREVGYVGTPSIMEAMKSNEELRTNLSAVAHLIHGSSEGRFSVTYCPGKLTREEVESVGFRYEDLDSMKKRYDIDTLRDGWNTELGEGGAQEEFYYISNPALGLWAVSSRFDDDPSATNDSSKCGAPVDVSICQEASGESGGVGGWKRPPAKRV